MIKDIWAERFWTVIVFKDAATRGATEGLSFSLLLGLFYLFSKLLLTVTRRSQSRFFSFAGDTPATTAPLVSCIVSGL